MFSIFQKVLFAITALGAVIATAVFLHWPLVGDSAQMHYICFLMDHRMAPYRVAKDMNMPGALLLVWGVIHTFGPGALPWHLSISRSEPLPLCT